VNTIVNDPTPELLAGIKSVYSGGAWRDGEGKALPVLDPSTERVIATIGTATQVQVEAALRAAKAAQPGWARLSYPARGRYLEAIADLVEENAEQLARVLALEVGKPLAQGRGELQWAVTTLRYQAGWARRIQGEIIPSDDPDEVIHLLRVPVGVVVAICAWNFPMAMFFRKVAPALLAGNAVVLKASETTPLAALALMRVIEQADLPPGVLNVVSGGPDVGAELVQHPMADLVTMTGSRDAGRAVMRLAADHIAKVSLELGGKAAAIVWSDADLELAVPALVLARHLNSGQVCTCAERVYVHEAIVEEFTAEYCSAVGKLRIGSPFDDVDMGPLVSAAQREKVTGLFTDALERGAKTVFQADAQLPAAGYWFRPAVLTGLSQDMPLMQQEVFGPVTPIIPISSLDQALAFANDSAYGLSGYVFSRSYDVIMRVTREMQCGEIYVNRTLGEAAQGHHSGHKQSGVGGEDGYHGLLRYTALRSVYHHFSPLSHLGQGR
jgi:lactaldehyde dehydrogenase / glycolaldehyde dehydrogenase